MGRSALVVDVGSVRLIVDDMRFGTEGVEDGLRNRRCGAVRAVESDLLSLEAAGRQRNEVTDVAVTARREIDGASDIRTGCQRHLRGYTVEVILDFLYDIIAELLAVSIDDLDAVIIVRIMGGGDHHATVEVLRAGHISDGRSCRHMQKVSICTGRSDTCGDCIFKHIAGTSRILTDDDAAVLAVFLLLSIVPSEELAYTEGTVRCQIDIGLTTVTIGSKIFSH